MDNTTITTDNFDAYTIDMDSACVSVDYDVADNIQYQLEQIAKEETDIEFE